MDKNNKIGISLGNVCYSAVWATKNKIRKLKKDGYKTCPFDLMVSNYDGIVNCIKDDFKHFCDPKYLTVNNNGIYNVYYNFGFNHESPNHKVETQDKYLYEIEKWSEGKEHFVNNNFKHFIDRYNSRINSFRDYLNNSNNIITFVVQFVYSHKPDENLNELRNALKMKYPNLKYRIIILKP
jgi:hypothetical protein